MTKYTHVTKSVLAKIRQVHCLGLLLSSTLFGAQRQTVVMQLDWIYNAQFAGIHQTLEQGYFSEKHLDVTILGLDRQQETVGAVLGEALFFGSAERNVLLKAYAPGAPIKALGTMFQGSPLGWMVISEKKISTFADLAENRVGIYSGGDKVIALMAKTAGMDPATFPLPHVSCDIDALLSGEVDPRLPTGFATEYRRLGPTQGEISAGPDPTKRLPKEPHGVS